MLNVTRLDDPAKIVGYNFAAKRQNILVSLFATPICKYPVKYKIQSVIIQLVFSWFSFSFHVRLVNIFTLHFVLIALKLLKSYNFICIIASTNIEQII